MSELQTQEGTQLEFPLRIDTESLQAFLEQWLAIEEEFDRLRESQQELRQEFGERLPLRGVETAIKKVRATLKLERHPKGSMRRTHLAQLEALVEQHLAQREAELERLAQEAANPETGEITA